MATLLNSNGTFSTFQAAIAACISDGSVFLSGTASADDVSNRLSRINGTLKRSIKQSIKEKHSGFSDAFYVFRFERISG